MQERLHKNIFAIGARDASVSESTVDRLWNLSWIYSRPSSLNFARNNAGFFIAWAGRVATRKAGNTKIKGVDLYEKIVSVDMGVPVYGCCGPDKMPVLRL